MIHRRRLHVLAVCLSLALLMFTNCGDDGTGPTEPAPYNALRIDIYDAAPLTSGYVYTLWAMTSSTDALSAEATSWKSLATFRAEPRGTELTANIVTPGGADIEDNTLLNLDVDWEQADSIYITIEATGSSPSSPQGPVYLVASVPDTLVLDTEIEGLEPLLDLTNIVGRYILATPTDNNPDNDTSGVWFLEPFVPPTAGLDLNELPDKWTYEGWARHGGTWLSTGKFSDPSGADDGNPYSGTNNPAPGFPGEDFLSNPGGPWVFVGGDSVMITIEPIPDTDTDQPFSYFILRGAIPLEPEVRFVHYLSSALEIQYVPSGNAVYKRSDES